MIQAGPSGDILAVARQLVDALGLSGARIRASEVIAEWAISTEPDADTVLQWWAEVSATIDALGMGRI